MEFIRLRMCNGDMMSIPVSDIKRVNEVNAHGATEDYVEVHIYDGRRFDVVEKFECVMDMIDAANQPQLLQE